MFLKKKKYVFSRNMPSLYTDFLPISKIKYQELLVLKRFCLPHAAEFFNNLPKEIYDLLCTVTTTDVYFFKIQYLTLLQSCFVEFCIKHVCEIEKITVITLIIIRLKNS